MDFYGIFCYWENEEECGNILVGNVIYSSKKLADQKRIITYGNNEKFTIQKMDLRDE